MTQSEIDSPTPSHDDHPGEVPRATSSPVVAVLAGFVVGALVAGLIIGGLLWADVDGAWVPYVPLVAGVAFLLLVVVRRDRT